MNLDDYRGMPEWPKTIDPHRHAYSSYMDRALEKKQLDEAVEAVDETVEHLYGDFTPATCEYTRGTRPLLEAIVDRVCAGCTSDVDKAIALVRWRRANYQHVPKAGLGTEEEILLGGYSLCHDASRCLVILAQVAGLGARLVIGLNNDQQGGHTLTEIHVAGKWSIFDPSPGLPHPYYPLPDGSFASAWDIRCNPDIPQRCEPEFESSLRDRVASFFRNYYLTNYSLEDSNRNMARRFLQLVAAHKIVENYDYMGHLNHSPLSAYADFENLLDKWLDGTRNPNGSAAT